jgi:glycosyltransferase involved in cell wall biosynthesis
MKSPLITVIMPVFNSEIFLAEAIDSILNQTFRDFEFLIIYDLSSDKSFSIIDYYHKIDSRIRVIMGEKKSLVGALNQGIDKANGKFIARMDADDIALPYRFERQLAWLQETGADITGSWIQRFEKQSKHVVKARKTDAAIKMEMLFCCPFKHPTILMRTTMAKSLKYDPAWHFAEDYDLWERAAKAGWKMTNVQEVLLLYRVHANQLSTATPMKQNNYTLQISLRYWEYLSQNLSLDIMQIRNFTKLFTFAESKSNIDDLEEVFIQLFKNQTTKEASDVLMDQLALQYMLAANKSLIYISNRMKLFFNFIWYKLLLFQFILWFIKFCKIHPGERRGLSLIYMIYLNYISNSWKNHTKMQSKVI